VEKLHRLPREVDASVWEVWEAVIAEAVGQESSNGREGEMSLEEFKRRFDLQREG
jgi:hypothetical protein